MNRPQIIWVTIDRLAELTGRSSKAIENLVYGGHLAEGQHWKWDAAGRKIFNTLEFDKWQEKPGRASTRGKRRSSSTSSGKESDTEKLCA